MIRNLDLKVGQNLSRKSLDLYWVNNILSELSNFLEINLTTENLVNHIQQLREIFYSIPSSKIKRYIAIALLIASVYKVNAQDEVEIFPQTGTVAVNGLRLRETPSLNGEILDHFNSGEQLEVLGFDDTQLWAMVNADEDADPEGFVYARYLQEFADRPLNTVNIENFASLTAQICVLNNIAYDSGESLCATQYYGTTILYAHNWSAPGRVLLDLYNSPGTTINIQVNGINYGDYVVVRGYETSGVEINKLLSPEALSAQNNDIISLVTTDPVRESLDPTARRITVLQRIPLPQVINPNIAPTT